MHDDIKSDIAVQGAGPCTHGPDARRIRIRSEQLLGGYREVIIEHAGDEYRLRLTSQGKLILTK